MHLMSLKTSGGSTAVPASAQLQQGPLKICRPHCYARPTRCTLANDGAKPTSSNPLRQSIYLAPAFVGGTIVPIRGPATASYGSRYTVRGRTGTVNGVHFAGSVVLRGRWNGGAWLTLARTRTDSHGTYSITIHLLRRGRLQLRLLIPGGGVATKTLRVD